MRVNLRLVLIFNSMGFTHFENEQIKNIVENIETIKNIKNIKNINIIVRYILYNYPTIYNKRDIIFGVLDKIFINDTMSKYMAAENRKIIANHESMIDTILNENEIEIKRTSCIIV